MASQQIEIHKFSHGITLVAEPMAEVSSAAFVFLVPAGVARDPQGRTGTASVLTELIFRGAGQMDNRRLNEQLDSLGLHRSAGAGSMHSSFSGALVGDNLLRAIELHAEVLQRPHLAEPQFEFCRELALQSLASLDDDPRQKIGLLVKEQFLSYPYGRPAPGKQEDLEQLSWAEVKEHWQGKYTPRGAILAVAGKIDFEELTEAVENYFGAWQGDDPAELPAIKSQSQIYHQANKGAQVHIGLMYPSVHSSSEDFYRALAAVSVLSGGMGSRLFTEVREKRGLCYAVGANHQIISKQGAVQCYVGSSPEKAQEALEVMIGELVKLSDGVTAEELARAKVGLRSSLIMQGESTGSRASGCGNDYYHLGRVRSLEEIEEAVTALTVDEVNDFVRRHKPGNFAVATIGPKELKVRI